MIRLRALKDIYVGGAMVRRDQVFIADDYAGRQYIRDHKAVPALNVKPAIAENRKKKVAAPKEKK